MAGEHEAEVRQGADGELTPAQALALVQEQAAALLRDAVETRAVRQPAWGSPPHQVHAALVTHRAALDRLESILVQAITLKDAIGSLARKREQAADDAWDDEARKARGRSAEYEGAQERYAAWRLKTRSQREAARLTREAADLADSAARRIDRMYRGLDSARLDLHRRMSAVVPENSLDRLG